jgi:hypothetical protein
LPLNSGENCTAGARVSAGELVEEPVSPRKLASDDGIPRKLPLLDSVRFNAVCVPPPSCTGFSLVVCFRSLMVIEVDSSGEDGSDSTAASTLLAFF